MAVPVLIITPNKGFGELIQQSLEEAGSYAASLAASGAEAVSLQKSTSPALCILDADLQDAPLDELVHVLRAENQEILFVVIPPEREIDPQTLLSLKAEKTLKKPFYLPALLDAANAVLQESGLKVLDRAKIPKASQPHLTKKDARPEQVPPEWLHDSAAAAAQFANLTVSEPAQAAMVTRAGEVWAFSTGLTDAAAQELARTVVEYWEGERGDLARFVKLDQTGEEHMMYAVSLGEDFLLVVLFEASAPFSRLRSIAAGMARALEQADPVEPAPFIEDDSPVEPASDPAPPFEHGPEEAADASQPLLEDVPPSVPEDWKPRSPYIPAEDREAEQDFPPSIETAPPPPQFIELPPEEETGEFIETDPAYQPGKISSSIPDVQADTIEQKRDTLIEYSSDTVASKPDKNGRVIKVEPVSPALYHLSYACVLVPRFPHHHLTGPFAEHLSTWVTQLCLAFGWRLEHLSIRPDYLQWIVNLPPSSSPGHLMRVIRQHTSRRLFVQYPRFEQDNPSGDFWAPGYFILSSDQPPPADLVQEFIQQTRYRQGISRTG